jgi:hypothetical protein
MNIFFEILPIKEFNWFKAIRISTDELNWTILINSNKYKNKNKLKD